MIRRIMPVYNQAVVLGLARTELIFFPGACMALCFRFVTKTELTTTNFLAMFAQHQGSFWFSMCPTPETRLGYAQ